MKMVVGEIRKCYSHHKDEFFCFFGSVKLAWFLCICVEVVVVMMKNGVLMKDLDRRK